MYKWHLIVTQKKIHWIHEFVYFLTGFHKLLIYLYHKSYQFSEYNDSIWVQNKILVTNNNKAVENTHYTSNVLRPYRASQVIIQPNSSLAIQTMQTASTNITQEITLYGYLFLFARCNLFVIAHTTPFHTISSAHNYSRKITPWLWNVFLLLLFVAHIG